MSENVKLNLTRIAVVLSILGGAVALGRTLIVDPDRVAAVEHRQTALEARQTDLEKQFIASREMLIRIDENAKALREMAKERR